MHKAFIAGIAAIALITASATPVAGGSRPVTSLGADAQSAPDALTVDLAAVATERGWTAAEASAFYASEEAVGDVAARVAKERPDAFVGSALSEDPYGAPTLYIKGTADSFVRQAVADAPVKIAIADGQLWSAEELHDRKIAIRSALMAAGFKEVSTQADITDGGMITVTVTNALGLDDSAAGIARMLPADLRRDVSFAAQDETQYFPEAIVAGGQAMFASGAFKCTSGFTVAKPSGSFLRGVITAEHCTGINQILDHEANPDIVTSTTFVNAYNGTYGDFEYHATAPNELDDFYANVSDRRDVTSWEGWAQFSVGEPICVFGWGTLTHSCTGLVNDPDFQCGNSPNLHQVVMTNHPTNGGDSGGPWFFNNRAYGIHQGDCIISGIHHSIFSKVDYLDEALGVSIATS